MQIKQIKMALLAATILVSSSFAANAAEGTRIATVNIQDVMSKSSAVQSINKQVDSRRQSFQDQMTKKEDQLRNTDQELSKQRTTLSPEAFEQKKKEFRTDVTSAQKDLQLKKIALDKGIAKSMGEVQKSVQTIVEELSKEKGFDMAVATNQLLWAKPDYDITAAVIERLNKALPEVKVNVEAATASAPAPSKTKAN